MSEEILLAIEGSGSELTVALAQGEQVVSRSYTEPRQHTQHLLVAINAILAEQQCDYAALSAIAFSAGPGSFTGLRLVASVVQAIAFVHDIPVLPISSLAVKASAVADDASERLICVADDARQIEVYYGLYQRDQSSVLQTHHADCLTTPEQLLLVLQQFSEKPLAIGDAWQLPRMAALKPYYEFIDTPGTDSLCQQVLQLARLAWRSGQAQPAEQALPQYIRDQIGSK